MNTQTKIKDRLLSYLSKRSIKKAHFYRLSGLSNGYLDKNCGFNSSAMTEMHKAFPDLDLHWLITGHPFKFDPLETNIGYPPKPLVYPPIEIGSAFKTAQSIADNLSVQATYYRESLEFTIALKKHMVDKYLSKPTPGCTGSNE